ncbi:hypothetical protein BS47DRAFT_1364747 [Hydnum rufescens UP504]|uniref:Uncharacterized protein n=1 Tax=Hydnum rufescens UP504 TaxID=1448309 RepID=A0A9P6AQP5_9AGAM|nr:hypothetical protein BS47DRAFT_1364747 [Hydnum rufescens UP504]
MSDARPIALLGQSGHLGYCWDRRFAPTVCSFSQKVTPNSQRTAGIGDPSSPLGSWVTASLSPGDLILKTPMNFTRQLNCNSLANNLVPRLTQGLLKKIQSTNIWMTNWLVQDAVALLSMATGGSLQFQSPRVSLGPGVLEDDWGLCLEADTLDDGPLLMEEAACFPLLESLRPVYVYALLRPKNLLLISFMGTLYDKSPLLGLAEEFHASIPAADHGNPSMLSDHAECKKLRSQWAAKNY